MEWNWWQLLIFQGVLIALCLAPMALVLLPHVGRHEWLEELLRPLADPGLAGARLVRLSDGAMPMPVLLAPCAGRLLLVSPDPLVDDERPGAIQMEVLRWAGESASIRLELFPREAGRQRAFRGLSPVALPAGLARVYVALADDPSVAGARMGACEASLGALAEAVDAVEMSFSVNARRILIRKLRRPRDADEMRLVVLSVEPIVRAIIGEGKGVPPDFMAVAGPGDRAGIGDGKGSDAGEGGGQVVGAGACDRAELAAVAGAADLASPVCTACGLPAPDAACRACQSPYHQACFLPDDGCRLFPCVARNVTPWPRDDRRTADRSPLSH